MNFPPIASSGQSPLESVPIIPGRLAPVDGESHKSQLVILSHMTHTSCVDLYLHGGSTRSVIEATFSILDLPHFLSVALRCVPQSPYMGQAGVFDECKLLSFSPLNVSL